MLRTDLERSWAERVKVEIEKGHVKSKTDFLSEIMIQHDLSIGYAWELLEPDKIFFYFPEVLEILSIQQPNKKIFSFDVKEALKKLEEDFGLYSQKVMPDATIGFDDWKNECPPIHLALFKDYPRILEYPSLRPYSTYLLENYVRQGTVLVTYFQDKFSDWTIAYIQEKSLNPGQALNEKYRLERRICKVSDLQEMNEANKFAEKLTGNVPRWKFFVYSKDLRKKATVSNVGLDDFRMIKYLARPTEKVVEEKEILIRAAYELVEGTEYHKVNECYIEEIKRLYLGEEKIWLPHLGIAKWRMMIFSPTNLRKKLLQKRILGGDSIRTYLNAKNVFYTKYPELVEI